MSRRILIVEDDEGIRDGLAEYLGEVGYSVTTAENGRKALDVLATMESPCLVLLDLMMPVMDGWQFLEALEADEAIASIPVVVVTAAGDTPNVGRPVLKKPIHVEKLLDTVRRYCGDPG